MCDVGGQIASKLLRTLWRAITFCWFVGGVVILMTFTSYSQTAASAASTQADTSEQSDGGDSPVTWPSNLETNLPLRVVMSPFHAGRLSLLSFTAYQGYDSNPNLKAVGKGSEFSAFNALVVYSIRRSQWELDLQYEPSVVVSPGVLAKNLSANAADFQAGRQLSPTWTLSLGEHFHYTPNLQSSIQGNGLALNLGGGISVQIPFLQSNESLLLNTMNGSLTHRLGKQSSVTFFADQTFIRLSPSIDLGREKQLPVSEALSTSGSVSYSTSVGLRDALSMTYVYRTEFSASFPHPAQYNVFNGGWSHTIAPELRLSFSGGPGFWDPGTKEGQRRTTLLGSAQLAKEFGNRGGIGLVFTRNDSFNGVISNSFSNDYGLRIDRRFSPRLQFTATGSYIQQEATGSHNLIGTTFAFEPAWSVTRNLSVFGQVRYLHTHGAGLFIAPATIVTAGVRWSWMPEKP